MRQGRKHAVSIFRIAKFYDFHWKHFVAVLSHRLLQIVGVRNTPSCFSDDIVESFNRLVEGIPAFTFEKHFVHDPELNF